MKKRCFVISPIGESGSPIREHADDVFDFIIRPAMDELEMHVYRSDHSQQIGRITEQMFTSILEDDLCIAILTYFNPNVFYELAVAHCAARPLIILIEKGQTIPFDIRDLRAVEYDLRPRPLRDRVYVTKIVELVRSLDAVNWDVQVPFGKNLTPLGSKHGHLTLYDKVEDYGTSESWINLLHRATTTLDISGLSLRWWTKFADMRRLFLQKAEQGCKIRCLLMHPDNAALPQYLHSGIKIGGLSHVVAEIDGTFSVLNAIAASHPNFEVRQVLIGHLSHQIVKTQESMLIAIRLYSQATSQFPLLECLNSSPLYRTIEGEFNTLWNLNGTDRAEPTVAPGTS
jgi:hypothetical protein